MTRLTQAHLKAFAERQRQARAAEAYRLGVDMWLNGFINDVTIRNRENNYARPRTDRQA